MKNLKMSLSAFAVLAIVGSALAFKAKPFNAGNIWCYASTPLATQACSADPGGTNILFNEGTSGGTTVNQCIGTKNLPFVTTATTCTPFVSGEQFVPTGE
jgi:hypothetical protein